MPRADRVQSPEALVEGEMRASEEDITLDEAEQILSDYVELSAHRPAGTTSPRGA